MKEQETQTEQKAKDLKELAKTIRTILENRTDIKYIPDLDFPIAKEILKQYHPKIILEKMYNTIIYRILALNFETENKDYDEGFFDCQKEILKRIDVVAREFGINIEDVENNLEAAEEHA